MNILFPKAKDNDWKYTKHLDIANALLNVREASLPFMKYSEALNVNDSYAKFTLSICEAKYVKVKDKLTIEKDFNFPNSSALVIDVKEDSEIIERNSGVNSFPLTIINLYGAKLKYKKIQNYDPSAIVVDNTIINIYDGEADIELISKGSKILRNNLKVVMHSGTSKIYGRYDVSQHLDNYLRVEHLNKSKSTQLYKGLSKGQVSFKGSIYISEIAENTSSKQLNKNIILDEGIVNIKPELEILNGNVECSHGATVSTLNEAELFYLISRGLSLDDAKKLLLESFLGDFYEYF